MWFSRSMVTDVYQSSVFLMRLSSQIIDKLFIGIWHPPIFPYRLQYSIFGRFGLNRRVRDGNGCAPKAHRHQNPFRFLLKPEQYIKPLLLLP